jgi:RNA polymerase sigma factor (sigma-70 family)
MSVRSVEALLQYLGRLCDEAGPVGDDALLKRFVEEHDRDAFAMLIARHGPMVLGTARRLVAAPQDAEDVFQAVFLSLARLAKSIRRGCTLPAWLHRATGRIAARSRGQHPPRREQRPGPVDNLDPGARVLWQEVRQALDEELQRLPERLRSPLVLCYLSGLTRDEAARQLGWSLGTLKRRLEEGRQALRSRLARRGIASVGLAHAVLTAEALQAAVSKELLASTLHLVFTSATVVPATISALVLHSASTMKRLAMKSVLALVTSVALGLGIHAGTGQPAPPAKADGAKARAPAPEKTGVQADDPLPAGSTLRFGTSRFRHGVHVKALAVSPDGKTALVANDNDRPRLFDLVSGRMLVEPNLGGIEAGVFSPDGRTLVTKEGPDLGIRDAATLKLLRTIRGPRAQNGPSLSWDRNWLKLTPDGKAIVVTSQSKVIRLIDFETGNTIRDFSIDNPESDLGPGWPLAIDVAFSPDGKRMASGGYDNDHGNYFARLWDVDTGKELRRFMLGKPGYGVGSLAFSPDGKTLATVGTQSGVVLRLFDVDTGKERRAFPKDGDLRATRGSVAFSPDGQMVAAARSSIRFFDVTTGEERLRIDRRASDLHFADDGKTLIGAVDGAIYCWHTRTGKTLTPDAADSAVELILVTPDGSRVVTRGQDGFAHIWDGVSGQHFRRFPVAWQRGLAMSPDGRFLAWPVYDYSVTFPEPQKPGSLYYGTYIRLYDIAADKVVDRFPVIKGDTDDLAFTSDGKKLVTADVHPGTARIWSVETATEERTFQVLPDALKEKNFQVGRTQLAPDGKTAAVSYTQDLGGRLGLRGPREVYRLWNVDTGRELPELNGEGRPVDRAFSPDGRLIVTAGGNGVYETATGKQVATLSNETYIRAAAFSRDGRFLATTGPEDVIQVWEVATWTRRTEFKGHRDRPTALAFAPGGQLLSGSLDTTVLAWEMRPPHVAASVSLESAWKNLAERNAGVSFRSEGRFLAAPAESAKFFADKVQPVEPLKPRRIRRLLTDVDSEEFAVREAASKALVELDQQVVPYLEETLKSTTSAEVRDRMKRILEQRQQAPLRSEQLRLLRVVMVVELIGDNESANLLKKWASGPVGALLTTEAAAALKRLEVVSKAKR